MAHKHNRRRVRPRSRNNNTPFTLTFDLSEYPTESSSFSAPFPSTISGPGRKQNYRPSTFRASNSNLASKLWQNRYLAWQNRDTVQNKDAFKLEDEQIKLFGGVPGDDVGLCYKMLEVFAGMNWIDTLD